MAVIRMRQGDVSGAQVALGRALQLDPNNWDAQVHQAQLYMNQGHFDEAIEIARSLNPEGMKLTKMQLQDYGELCEELGLSASER